MRLVLFILSSFNEESFGFASMMMVVVVFVGSLQLLHTGTARPITNGT